MIIIIITTTITTIILNILAFHVRQMSTCVQMQVDMLFFNAST
jgi:hypothetical protein